MMTMLSGVFVVADFSSSTFRHNHHETERG
jgi:hypothetical protein